MLYDLIWSNMIPCTILQNTKIQYNTMQWYNTIQYNTIQYNTIQYYTIQCNTMQQYEIIHRDSILWNGRNYMIPTMNVLKQHHRDTWVLTLQEVGCRLIWGRGHSSLRDEWNRMYPNRTGERGGSKRRGGRRKERGWYIQESKMTLTNGREK